MGRLIQDTPDDPVGYIINILQGIHKKQRIVTDLVSEWMKKYRGSSTANSGQSIVNDCQYLTANVCFQWLSWPVRYLDSSLILLWLVREI